MLWHRTKQSSAYPELPTAAVNDKLFEEPLVTRVSGFGFLDTVNGDGFSALRFFAAHEHMQPHNITLYHKNANKWPQ